MEATKELQKVSKTAWPILLAIGAGLLVIGFLIGFLPMWGKAQGAQAAHKNLQRETAVMQLQNLLGSAAVDARRGRYEPARVQTSDFYTRLSEELKRGTGSAFTPAQQEKLAILQPQRDDLITLLARNDPAGADRLIDLYVGYRDAVGQPENPQGKAARR
jgi:hypothetical protein